MLAGLGVPRAQHNERSALTLLALLDLPPAATWSQAGNPFMGITTLMNWFRLHYGKKYQPNTRETVRRQTMHQFMQMGLAVANPDQPGRPVNSPKYGYVLDPAVVQLAKVFGTEKWTPALSRFRRKLPQLQALHDQERAMLKIPVNMPDGSVVEITAGGQNTIIRQIIEEFCPRFTPGGRVIYLGDAGAKVSKDEMSAFQKLDIKLDAHGKMPDVVIFLPKKNWLVLVEAAATHGPIDNKRKLELQELMKGSQAGLVFVTAVLNRKALIKYLRDIAWESEVWVADNPSHLIHFNGERFLGPYSA